MYCPRAIFVVLSAFLTTGASANEFSHVSGLWAIDNKNENYCKEYADGTLERRDRAAASASGLVQISESDLEWMHTNARCQIKRIEGRRPRFTLNANCEFKLDSYKNTTITIVTTGINAMTMSFHNQFKKTMSYVKCGG